jgi:hypothetical protein
LSTYPSEFSFSPSLPSVILVRLAVAVGREPRCRVLDVANHYDVRARSNMRINLARQSFAAKRRLRRSPLIRGAFD